MFLTLSHRDVASLPELANVLIQHIYSRYDMPRLEGLENQLKQVAGPFSERAQWIVHMSDDTMNGFCMTNEFSATNGIYSEGKHIYNMVILTNQVTDNDFVEYISSMMSCDTKHIRVLGPNDPIPPGGTLIHHNKLYNFWTKCDE